MFPFQKEGRKIEDEKMKQMMHKESGKILTFSPVDTSILKQRAKKLAMPDEYARNLRSKIAKGRRLK